MLTPMKRDEKIRLLLEDPPMKKVKCPNCNGYGMANPRGMLSSDPCPECKDAFGYGRGKVMVQDYDKTVVEIRKIYKSRERRK